MTIDIRLEELGEQHQDEYQALIRQWIHADGLNPFNDADRALADFPAFLRDLEQERSGNRLPAGVARQITMVAIIGRETVAGEFRSDRGWSNPTEPPTATPDTTCVTLSCTWA